MIIIEINYLLQIKAFYLWLEQNALSSAAIPLWHGLMYIWNQSYWTQPFTPSMTSIILRTGMSIPTIRRARNELQNSGLLEIKEQGGRRLTEYKLITFHEKNEPLYKQNKIKQNKTNSLKKSEKTLTLTEEQIKAYQRAKTLFEGGDSSK